MLFFDLGFRCFVLLQRLPRFHALFLPFRLSRVLPGDVPVQVVQQVVAGCFIVIGSPPLLLAL